MNRYLTRITYVEDEPDICKIARIALEHIGGYTLDVCTSGPEALSRVPGFKPDIILLDVMMPGMDGVETLKALKRDPIISPTPVIFMTARLQDHEVNEYKREGASDVIAKPFDPMKLADQVFDIWKREVDTEADTCNRD